MLLEFSRAPPLCNRAYVVYPQRDPLKVEIFFDALPYLGAFCEMLQFARLKKIMRRGVFFHFVSRRNLFYLIYIFVY